MLVGRRGGLALLRFIVSRAHARGSDPMLCDAYPRGISRGGLRQFGDGANVCCDDRCTDSSFVAGAHITRERDVSRT